MIDLQFVAGTHIYDRAIEGFSHGWMTHVDFVMPGTGYLLGARFGAIGAIPAGVQIRPPNYEPFARAQVVSLPATEAQATSFRDFLGEQLGKPYDEKAIAGFMVGRTDWSTPGAWFCSKLQGDGLVAAGVFPFKLSVADNGLTPRDLYLACSVLANIPVLA